MCSAMSSFLPLSTPLMLSFVLPRFGIAWSAVSGTRISSHQPPARHNCPKKQPQPRRRAEIEKNAKREREREGERGRGKGKGKRYGVEPTFHKRSFELIVPHALAAGGIAPLSLTVSTVRHQLGDGEQSGTSTSLRASSLLNPTMP